MHHQRPYVIRLLIICKVHDAKVEAELGFDQMGPHSAEDRCVRSYPARRKQFSTGPATERVKIGYPQPTEKIFRNNQEKIITLSENCSGNNYSLGKLQQDTVWHAHIGQLLLPGQNRTSRSCSAGRVHHTCTRVHSTTVIGY